MAIVALLLLLASVAPAAFMLHFVYVRDKYQREPLRAVLLVYFAGFFTVIPALVGELAAGALVNGASEETLAGAALIAFAVVGVAEEGSKFLFLMALVYRRSYFDEPYDGILYAVAVGLGFATVENLAYVFLAGSLAGSAAIAVLRALLSVPAHALFGVVMGHFTGRAKFEPDHRRRRRLLALGLATPVLAHGLYDFPLLLAPQGVTADVLVAALAVLAGTMILLWTAGVRMLHQAQAASPFQRPPPFFAPLGAITLSIKFCTQCGARAAAADRFCRICGTSWRVAP